jgi:ElaB/YqjD/DUF883 family membrane-anchored ribosome-binding protein
MGATAVEPANETATTFREKAADVVRQASHVSHEARLFKSVAADAIEDGMYAAKRAWKRGARELDDFRDEATHRVKQEPLKALGIAAGAGLFLGVVLGFLLRGSPRRRTEERS